MTKDEREQLKRLVERFDGHEETMQQMADLLPVLKQMAEAWESAAWFTRAVKFAAGLVAAVGAAWAVIKIGVSHK